MESAQLTVKKVPIALFAGKGDLPRLLINIFQSQSRPFIVLAFKGQTPEDFLQDVPHEWISFGKVGKALDLLKKNNIKEIVMAGGIARPALSEVRPDWEGVKWMAKIGTKALGDDSLLKLLIHMIEEQGYTVVGPDRIVTDLLAQEKLLTSLKPTEQDWRDIGRGVEILTALEPVDVGQAVVIQEGLVLGVEAIEGTDALIERAGRLRRPGQGGVLVKLSKLQQEHRADLPVIGLETMKRCLKAGVRGVVIEAGRTLLLNQREVITFADENAMFVLGLASNQCHGFL